MKKVIFKYLIVIFLLLFNSSGLKAYTKTILKGSVNYYKVKGKKASVSIKSNINYFFSLEGDKVTSYINEDIKLNKNEKISKGSRLVGSISKIIEPKKFGIDGSYEIDFTEIITPDGKKIPIQAKAITDHPNNSEQIAKILTYDSALISYGALNGALAGIQESGIPLTISSNGLTALAGAGIGAGLGIIGSIRRKGEIPKTNTLKPVTVTFSSDLYILNPELPTRDSIPHIPNPASSYKGFRFNPSISKKDIDISIKDIKNKRSASYGKYVIVDFHLKNNSKAKLNIKDLVLVNIKTNTKVYADLLLTGSQALKTINPNEDYLGSIAFLTDLKDGYNLCLYDPLDNTEIVKLPLN